MRNIKKELKIAYELANNFDYVPDDIDKVREYVETELQTDLDEKITEEDIENIVGYYMGENIYSINEQIRTEYFKTED